MNYCWRCKSEDDVASTILQPEECVPLCVACRSSARDWRKRFERCGQCGTEEVALEKDFRPGWVVPPYPPEPLTATGDTDWHAWDGAEDAWYESIRCPGCAVEPTP